MGYWVDFLMRKLEEVGVIYLLNTNIEEISCSADRVDHMDIDGKILQTDQLTWSIPPGLFFRLASYSASFPLPKFRKTAVYDFAFLKPLNSECYYINVYDASRLSGRITLYPNLTSDSDYYRCTVEVLGADDFDFENATGNILDELRSMGVVNQDNPCAYQLMRTVNNGFPLPELSYTSQTVAESAALNAAFDNVTFIGRAPGRFFISDVLTHTYKTACEDGMLSFGPMST